MKFSVVTPIGAVVECEITEVTVPGALGEFGVFPNHRPSVMMVGGGALQYVSNGQSERLFVKGGIAEIGPEHVTILTDIAVREADLGSANLPKTRQQDEVEYLTDDLWLKQQIEARFESAVS